MHVLLLVFQRYDPNFMACSLDEAYLDITDVCKERDIKSEEVKMVHWIILAIMSFKSAKTLLFVNLRFVGCRRTQSQCL